MIVWFQWEQSRILRLLPLVLGGAGGINVPPFAVTPPSAEAGFTVSSVDCPPTVTDLDGNALGGHTWTFVTEPVDVAPPAVASAAPAAGAIDVVGTRPLTIVFDEPVDPEQAAYIGVSPDGPFKPEHYRY